MGRMFFVLACIVFVVSACSSGVAGEWERVTQSIPVGMPNTRGMNLQEANRALQENRKTMEDAGKINKVLAKWSSRIVFKIDGTALLSREGNSGMEELQYSLNGDRITFKSPFGNVSYQFSLKEDTLTFLDGSLSIDYKKMK